jgi:peptidoglycan hydrolase-like protein with peptidoglycan-binding domain
MDENQTVLRNKERRGSRTVYEGSKTCGEVVAWAQAAMAAAGGHNYVAQFWQPGGYKLPAAEPEPEAAPEPEPAGAVPLPAPRPDDAPPIEDAISDLVSREPPRREAPATFDDDGTVAYVQARLRALNYFTAGRIDGDLGGMTRGAIVRFKHEHGLTPETPDIDAAFLAALRDPACASATVAPERASTTAEDLRANGSETITLTDRIKKTGAWLLGLAGFGGLTEGGDITEQVTTGTQLFRTIKQAMTAIGLTPSALLWIAGAALAVWYFGNRIERHRVEQARTGQHL